VLVSSLGNPHLQSEDLVAYELGYRLEATKHLSFDAAGFYNDYDHLIAPTGITTSVVTGSFPPYAAVEATQENAGSSETYGVEASARWDVTDYWHVTANYSWLNVQLGFNSTYLQAGPEHQAQLRSSLDLPHHFELNGAVSFVDGVNAPYGTGQMTIPSYVRLDLGLVWHATKNLELGVWGQNLAQDRHAEFTSYKTTLVTEIPRSVVGRVTWRF
jgi:iron complex outermembrane receptor protein